MSGYKIERAGEHRIVKDDKNERAYVFLTGFLLTHEYGSDEPLELFDDDGNQIPHFTITPGMEVAMGKKPPARETLDEAIERFCAHEHWPGITLHHLRDHAATNWRDERRHWQVGQDILAGRTT